MKNYLDKPETREAVQKFQEATKDAVSSFSEAIVENWDERLHEVPMLFCKQVGDTLYHVKVELVGVSNLKEAGSKAA